MKQVLRGFVGRINGLKKIQKVLFVLFVMLYL